MDTTTTDIRRDNLRLLIREAGGTDRIASKLNMAKSELSQLTNLKNNYRIDTGLARDIELKLGLEAAWLDMPHEYLPSEARQIAHKWLILPSSIQEQIQDYIDLQIESLRHELNPEQEEDITDFSKMHAREPSWES